MPSIYETSLRAVVENYPINEDLVVELIDFAENGVLNRESFGNLIEAILVNNLFVAVSIFLVKFPEDYNYAFVNLVKVVEEGMPLAAMGSQNIMSYARSRRDTKRRL